MNISVDRKGSVEFYNEEKCNCPFLLIQIVWRIKIQITAIGKVRLMNFQFDC